MNFSKNKLYWIYGLIFIILLSIRFLGSTSTPELTTTTEQEFKQVMLMRGDVERIDLVQNKEIVRVYIKSDRIHNDYYVQKFKKKLDKTKVKDFPLFEFSVTDWNSFNERLQKFNEQKGIQNIPQNTIKEKDNTGFILNNFFTLIFCVILFYIAHNFLKSKKGNPYEEDYKNALKGNDKLRALELGRLYYRWSRKDKTLTVYDETAIANDLSIMKE